MTGEMSAAGNRKSEFSGSRGGAFRVQQSPSGVRRRGFTLLELMIAIGILMMVIGAIYAIWTAIMKGTRVGMEAAANVQRLRIAMRTVEDALVTAVSYTENIRYYHFDADGKSDNGAMSFVARLPANFPGVGRAGEGVVRRVDFFVRSGDNNQNELVLRQAPMLLDPDANYEPYTLVLARNVKVFIVEFFDANPNVNDWVSEWKSTNSLPKLVRVGLGVGGEGGPHGKAQEVSTRLVALPANAVQRDIQAPMRPPGR